MNLGKAIKDARKSLGLTQAELAKEIAISSTALSQIESGQSKPSPKTVEKLCNFFKVPEGLFYILALEDADVPEERRDIFQRLFPSIRGLAMQVFSVSLEDNKQEE